jgi:putative pyruvate formate lyase activating enzyme
MNNQVSNSKIDPAYEPGYLKLHRNGELKRRGDILWQKMEICDLCPRECEKKRLDGQKGDCGSTAELEVSSFNPHFGEEDPLVMDGGSGTIFFTHCSLRCVFCINYQISILGQGQKQSIDDLAEMMLRLQKIGCENINVVTPTHYTPHIVKALDIAAARGLRLPLVYNTSGYEKTETLKLLDGIVDIYLPDFKYFDGDMASRYSNEADNYPEMAKDALLEMQGQVGTAQPEKSGKIFQGLMIRHLVLPNNVSGTKEIMNWISSNLPNDTYINLMSQYRPSYKARNYPQLSRSITNKEYYDAVQHARRAGLTNVEIQG